MNPEGDRRGDRAHVPWATSSQPGAEGTPVLTVAPHLLGLKSPSPEEQARSAQYQQAIRELEGNQPLFDKVRRLAELSEELRGHTAILSQNYGGISIADGQLTMRTYQGVDASPTTRLEVFNDRRAAIERSLEALLSLARDVKESAASSWLKAAAREYEHLSGSTFEAVVQQRGVRLDGRYVLPEETEKVEGESHTHCLVRCMAPFVTLSAVAGGGAAAVINFFLPADSIAFIVETAAAAFVAYKAVFGEWADASYYDDMVRPYSARLAQEGDAIIDWLKGVREPLAAALDAAGN